MPTITGIICDREANELIMTLIRTVIVAYFNLIESLFCILIPTNNPQIKLQI